ncbi:MAG: hypothetical protein GKR96_13045 [Gammaproteobacteria bacterium]|nr:hypothetical protein [Gammaproteobacteria bacterium]
MSGENVEIRQSHPDNCHHFGDFTHYRGLLFLPLEKCRSGVTNRIYVYDTQLRERKRGFFRNEYQSTKAPWIGIHPHNGFMYSSKFRTSRINVYSRFFEQDAHLTPLHQIQLDYYVRGIQGGVFSDNGWLYLSTNEWSTGNSGFSTTRDRMIKPGILVFRIQGKKGQFVRYISTGGLTKSILASEEMEGLTIWPLNSNQSPRVQESQLHWILLDNDASHDDVTMKHIRFSHPNRL